MTQPNSATAIVEDLSDLAEDTQTVPMGRIVDAFGARGFGPLVFLPAMVELTPLGGIPGLPSLLALFISLIAVQILMGRSGFWVPDAIRHRDLDERTVRRIVHHVKPVARRMDRWFGRRLRPFAVGVARQLAAVVVITLCLTVPVLELIPFASSAPMLAIGVIGLALTAEDGLLMLVGMGLAIAALIVAPLMLIWA